MGKQVLMSAPLPNVCLHHPAVGDLGESSEPNEPQQQCGEEGATHTALSAKTQQALRPDHSPAAHLTQEGRQGTEPSPGEGPGPHDAQGGGAVKESEGDGRVGGGAGLRKRQTPGATDGGTVREGEVVKVGGTHLHFLRVVR